RLFVHTEADLGPKVNMVRRILNKLSISPSHTVFVDEDPFERDSIAVQLPGISTWSVADLQTYLAEVPNAVTKEGSRRTEMYIEQQARLRDEEAAGDYLEFLRRCNIRITIRLYTPHDTDRVQELLVRTHRMSLTVLPPDEALQRVEQAEAGSVVIAEM